MAHNNGAGIVGEQLSSQAGDLPHNATRFQFGHSVELVLLRDGVFAPVEWPAPGRAWQARTTDWPAQTSAG